MNRQHILPQAWLEGLVYTYSTSLSRPAFRCGEVRSSGWWYYFPLSMAFKTPLATISAIILAATTPYWWQHRGAKLGWPFIALTALIVAGMPLLLRPFFHAGLREYLPVYSCVIVGLLTAAILGTAAWAIEAQSGELWPVLAAGIGPIIYMMFALRSHLDLGIRHVLPIYPFLFILIGVAGARSRMIWPKTTGTIIVVFILGLAVETFGAYPDFIPFFNVAAGGSRGGLHLLGNSDIDWGQELANLGRWQRAHPNRQLELCYFGFADPAYYGIRSSKFPDDMIRANDGAPEAAASEVFAISAPMLQGSAIDPSQAAYFEPFHHMQPIAVLGGSIYLFDPPPQWVRTAAGGP
jgi:hypothetical protein